MSMNRSIKTYAMSGYSEQVGFAIRDQGRVTRTEQPHRHEFFQMRLDLAGASDQHIGVRRRLLGPGSISFVLPQRIHRGGRCPDSRFYVMNFHHRFLRPGMHVDEFYPEGITLERSPELAPFLFQEFMEFRLDGADLASCSEACRNMMAQQERQRLFSVDLIRANLLLVIGTVCQRYERELSQLAALYRRQGSRPDVLARIKRYIREHLVERMKLAEVAAAADVSPNYVTHLLKKETGKTFIDFVTAQRLQRAQELLAGTALQITHIAGAVGFEDDAYFARRFKQYLRVSPSEYRRGARGKS